MSLYGIGETYHGEFNTYNTSGVLVNADSTPTGLLVAGGTDGAAIIVTNPSTGLYKFTASLVGRAVGDDCYVRYTATVGGVTQDGRTPPFRVAFPAALAGGNGILTAGSGTLAGQVPFISVGGVQYPQVDVEGYNGQPALYATGTAQGGGASTITLASAASSADNFYRYWSVRRLDTDEWAIITGYVGSTRVATIRGAWAGAAPTSSTKYDLDPPASADLELWEGAAPAALDGIGHVLASGSRVLSAPRDITSVADSALTEDDALWAAIGAGAGKQDASSGTTLVVQTPSTGATLRTFALTTAAIGSTAAVKRA